MVHVMQSDPQHRRAGMERRQERERIAHDRVRLESAVREHAMVADRVREAERKPDHEEQSDGDGDVHVCLSLVCPDGRDLVPESWWPELALGPQAQASLTPSRGM